jgi:hypothetical protein
MWWPMRLWPPRGIEYWPRYSIVLFWRDIVDLDVFWAMVRPSTEDVVSNFKQDWRDQIEGETPLCSLKCENIVSVSLGLPWSDLWGQKSEVRGLETHFQFHTRLNEIINGVLILDIYQFDPILRIRPNLLHSGLISQCCHGGINSLAVARTTTNARGVHAIKKHKICVAEGQDIRALVTR